MRKFGLLIEKTATSLRYVGFACLAAMTGIVTAGTLMRYIFRDPFEFTEEVISVLCVPLIVFPLAYVFQKGGHVRVNMVVRALPLRWQQFFERLSEFLTLILLVLLAREFYAQIILCYSVNRQFETILFWPLWPVRALGFIGLSFTIIYITKNFIQGISEGKNAIVYKG